MFFAPDLTLRFALCCFEEAALVLDLLMLLQGTVLSYESYVCVGQLQRVAACMVEVYKAAAANARAV